MHLALTILVWCLAIAAGSVALIIAGFFLFLLLGLVTWLVDESKKG